MVLKIRTCSVHGKNDEKVQGWPGSQLGPLRNFAPRRESVGTFIFAVASSQLGHTLKESNQVESRYLLEEFNITRALSSIVPMICLQAFHGWPSKQNGL